MSAFAYHANLDLIEELSNKWESELGPLYIFQR